MRDYRKYKVWELGHQLTLAIYAMTKKFPKEETYGITSQMRRSSYSIPANIAEGCGRESDAEFRRFLVISQGSASELEYFLIFAKDLNFLKEQDFEKLDDEVNKVKRSLNNLINKI